MQSEVHQIVTLSLSEISLERHNLGAASVVARRMLSRSICLVAMCTTRGAHIPEEQHAVCTNFWYNYRAEATTFPESL